MKNIILTILLSIALFSSEYIVDSDKSSIRFEASKFLFVGVDGLFKKFSGTIQVDENSNISLVNGIVFSNSIDTKNLKRDDNLRADDYFNIVKFPNIVFISNEIGKDTIKAKVSIKGIQKELIFKISEFELKDSIVKFKLSSVVDRQDFMLNGSLSSLIANNVEVFADIIATKK